MRKRRRKKNFLPALIFIFLFWTIFIIIFFFVDPKMIKNFIFPNSYAIFFIILFPALFLTLAIVFGNSRRGFLSALGIIVFLILRISGLGNILNAFLIVSFIFTIEYHFTRRKEYDKK